MLHIARYIRVRFKHFRHFEHVRDVALQDVSLTSYYTSGLLGVPKDFLTFSTYNLLPVWWEWRSLHHSNQADPI